MNNSQSNHERMADKTLNELNQNSDVYQGSPKFQGYVQQHSSNLLDFRKWKNKQQLAKEIVGMTQNKNVLRLLMIDDGATIIGAIKTIGSVNNDNALIASIDYTDSFLKGCSESEFIAASVQVKGVASNNAAALLDEGITAQMITNYAADTTSFQTMMTQGSTKKSDVATYTANLKTADKKMMNHLNNVLDNSIKQWKKAAPDFVSSYKNSRKIINYGAPASGIRGHIVDLKTGQKLKNILFEIVELEATASSGHNGFFEFLTVPAGNYTLRYRGVDYITTEIPVKVEEGKITIINLTIEHKPIPEAVPA